MKWIGKFCRELNLRATQYVIVNVIEDNEDAEVLLFPHQAREIAEQLLKLADEADVARGVK